jgi:hypothetical protein
LEYSALIIERDVVIQSMYDGISPTMAYDYDTGQSFSISYNPESAALNIISTKERSQKVIDIVERKAQLFEAGMETLTDWGKGCNSGLLPLSKNDLGLSPQYSYQVLESAQQKLCSFLQDCSRRTCSGFIVARKAEINQKIQAS